MADGQVTLEWFGRCACLPCIDNMLILHHTGATTYRLRAKGLTLWLDTWLERPSSLPRFLSIADVKEADYIFISHAHFDHLPGADRLAKQTGATVIANGEAINVLRLAGVPDEQLLPVAGGERMPLFNSKTRTAAKRGECAVAPGPPGAPLLPDPSLAVISVHAVSHLYMTDRYKQLILILTSGQVYTAYCPGRGKTEVSMHINH